MNTATNGYYARVSLAFARKMDTELIAFTRNVITQMTGNALYPNPLPTLATLTTTVNDFESKVHEALNGGRIEIAARNAVRLDLLGQLRQLASYVQTHCNADLLALLSSGFNPVRAPSPAGILPAPANPRLSLTGKTGELWFKFDRVTNAQNYTIQTATASSGPWEDYDLSGASRVLLEGLTPGTIYWVQACANGSAGASEWTAPISAMAI